MRTEKSWLIERRIERTSKALESNAFRTVYAPTKTQALQEALRLIPANATVGVGGSVTIREIGLIEELERRGNRVLETWRKITPEEDLAIRKKQLTCDVFVSSSNAVTEDGKLVNADGTGNRVAAMIFGPPKVVVVAGVNKIVPDVHAGIERIRNVAAPMNVRRVGGTTPCVVERCNLEACTPPSRHCHAITILEKCPTKTDTTVILVGEELGF
ncbi:lactate utilization protein [Candidatus Bathyarchaeota archaeon]|nr:lactate utilization protein [Candidatus Bathyarchaeota archaeon]